MPTRPCHRLRIVAATALTVLLALAAPFGGRAAIAQDAATPSPGASPALPLTIANDSGDTRPVFVYILGTDLATGQLGYVDTDGTFHAWTLPGSKTPVEAPDVAISGPANGASLTLHIPRNLSGRVYVAFGEKLAFSLVDAGLVQPAPWAAGDPNAGILFDWTEFTYNDAGIWINASQVDQFAVPQAVSVTAADGTTRSTGQLKPGGRQGVIEAMLDTPGWERTVVTGANGEVLRVLSPGKALEAGLMAPDYLDPAIDAAWDAYRTGTLTVIPFADEPDTRFSGRTENGALVFTDDTGREVASFPKPTTADVWECDGALAAPNDHVVGPIARTLCAALHRGNLATVSVQPGDAGTAATFYTTAPCNHYAQAIHAAMADGRAYAFAFDDVLAQESLVHDGSPVAATITIQPLEARSATPVAFQARER
ncbi:MAG: beta-1,3-glucanase family protein [Thermomicrobiales bacterium]